MDLSEVVQFCIDHKWIFDTKMTNVFLDRPWNRAPPNWQQSLAALKPAELKSLLHGKDDLDCTQSLLDFIKEALVFINHCRKNNIYHYPSSPCLLPSYVKVGMTHKKIHEVSKLAPLIHQIYTENSCNVIVDIGCGLGYLGHVLSHEYDLKVVGFELQDSNCHNASKKLEQQHGRSQIIYQMKFDASSQCRTEVMDAVSSVLMGKDNIRICLVGLHCCGDLTPAMLSQFCNIEQCIAMVCMGCCYHRMLPSSDVDEDGYKFFPISTCLKDIFRRNDVATKTFNGFALRMACQETASRWVVKPDVEIEQHTKHVVYRAVLEYCCLSYGFDLTKCHRKLVSGAASYSNFQLFTEAVMERMSGLDTFQSKQIFREKMHLSYEECKDDMKHVQWYNILQVIMQGVLEAIILQDRLLYHQERGLNSRLVNVFDDSISPRNAAIITNK